MDGVMLGFVAREMKEKLLGGRVDRVLQPESDELHLVIRGFSGTHRLLICSGADGARIHITGENKPNPQEPPMFCMLMRKLLGGCRLTDVRQIGGDRVLEMDFEGLDELGERTVRILSCELMGRHSNIILRSQSGRILDCIRHVGADVNRVREIKPGVDFVPPPSQGKLSPEEATEDALRARLADAPPRLDKALCAALAGVSAETAREWAMRLAGAEEAYLEGPQRQALARPLAEMLSQMPQWGPPVMVLDGDGGVTGVHPFPQKHLDASRQREVSEGISAALDLLYKMKDRRERMTQKSASLTRSLKTHLERCEKKLQLHMEEMENEEKAEEARIRGELLTASLHLASKGADQVTVPDYYDPEGGERVIPLDVRLSASQNAQKYYRQYQKLREARKHAQEQLEQAQKEQAFLQMQLDDVRKCENTLELDEIRAELVKAGYLRLSHNRSKGQKARPSKPGEAISSDGYTLRFGRNSAQNERVTASAAPEDWWFHAKDMPGSHVVILGAGEDVPDQTLLEAATLAAYFSRGYQSDRVPVDMTRRKYVKKPSGSAPGMMIYTHQKTLFIRPDEGMVKGLLGERME